MFHDERFDFIRCYRFSCPVPLYIKIKMMSVLFQSRVLPLTDLMDTDETLHPFVHIEVSASVQNRFSHASTPAAPACSAILGDAP